MLRGAVFLGFLLEMGSTTTERATTVAATAPNILWIMSDDMGYAEPSVFGQTTFRTPNIDRLAASGLRFTDAYTGAPVCAPSRCALMTGLHTGHTYIRCLVCLTHAQIKPNINNFVIQPV